MSKRYVHVSVIIEQESGVYHVSPSCQTLIHRFKDCTAESFEGLFNRLTMLKAAGASELVWVESEGTTWNMGGFPWYNCQSMVRDFARLEIGFLANPLHLSLQLRYGLESNFTVIKRILL